MLARCVDGVKILDLCQMGDELMLEETAKVYKKEKELKKGQPNDGTQSNCARRLFSCKIQSVCCRGSPDGVVTVGIAFPTCISVNNCVCHFSPLKSDSLSLLYDGDLIKMSVSWSC